MIYHTLIKLALRLQRKGWFGLSKFVVNLTERK
jgi:hypothetical protein